MRRRLATILTAALLGSAVLLPLTAMPAMGAEHVVLAAEAGETDAGPEPMPPDDEDNEFAPQDYEANVTWRANNYLFALILFAAVYVGLMYYLRVARPRSKSEQS